MNPLLIPLRWLRRSTPRNPIRRPGRKSYRPALEMLEDRLVPTIYTVTSLADDGSAGTLRSIIQLANTNHTGMAGSPDTIVFNIPLSTTESKNVINVGAPGGIAPGQALPVLSDIAVIDGTTAPGYNYRTGILIELNGSNVTSGNGLTLTGGDSTVKGLAILNFPGNGIEVDSSNNTIGGGTIGTNLAGAPNNPAGRITSPLSQHGTTTPVFVRPPDGNVISGNHGDGVLIQNASDNNILEGNWIGTTVAGTAPDGNFLNGVDIENSNGNELLGTFPVDNGNPFVIYNVISGNDGNGLVINNSNQTKVFANFFGMGADNNTAVGNDGDGVLIEGTSDQTTFGGNIPLGNVVAGNKANGVVVAGNATRTILGNTFAGVAAFNPKVSVGNTEDGILITSPGNGTLYLPTEITIPPGTILTTIPPGITTLVLTCQMAGNGENGLEIAGNATAVQVAQSVAGVQTNGHSAEPNGANGVEIDGDATGILIGGFEPSVEGDAGSASFLLASNVFSGNKGDGLLINGTQGAHGITVINNFIGTDITGSSALPNGKNGIEIDDSSGNEIGAPLGSTPTVINMDRNIIAFNTLDGVLVNGGTGDSILGNSIFSNGHLGIDLVSANNNAPAPVIKSGILGSFTQGSQITGTLTGKANTTYQIELFASPANTPNSGQVFLGYADEMTNGLGVVNFTITDLTAPSSAAAFYVTGTATDLSGNTGVFSPTSVAVIHNGRYH